MTHEPFEFSDWSDKVQARLLDYLVHMKVSKSSMPPEVDNIWSFEHWNGTSGEVLTYLSDWVAQASKHCAEMTSHAALPYNSFRFIVLVEDQSVTLWPTLIGDGIRVEGGVSLASATILRSKETTYHLWATKEEGFKEWKANEHQIVSSSLEELLASGEFILADEALTGYRSEGRPGATFYDESRQRGKKPGRRRT